VRGPARLLALVLAITTIAPLGVASGTEGEERPGPCPIARAEGQRVQDWVRDLIRCAERRWEVPGGAERAICIAEAESGLDPKTVSATGRTSACTSTRPLRGRSGTGSGPDPCGSWTSVRSTRGPT